jgi:SAM-dependent methyltransferase
VWSISPEGDVRRELGVTTGDAPLGVEHLVGPVEPSLFYTGLVAHAYGPLRSVVPDPSPYARFIRAFGEPALELGCGDGDPMLALLQQGIDVEGLDASPDMLDRCRDRAAEAGVQVVLHESRIEAMDLGRRYRSIFLAGPTFNLLVDDETAAVALARIAQHLESGGAALVPLFVPGVADHEVGRSRTREEPDGTVLRVTTLSVERDESTRQQRSLLRYESTGPGGATVLDRTWVLHWHTQESFRALVSDAGLHVTALLDPDGRPATPDADQFVFLLTVP